jgi:hypothetical protein
MSIPVTVLGSSLQLWDDAMVLPLAVLAVVLFIGGHRADRQQTTRHDD